MPALIGWIVLHVQRPLGKISCISSWVASSLGFGRGCWQEATPHCPTNLTSAVNALRILFSVNKASLGNTMILLVICFDHLGRAITSWCCELKLWICKASISLNGAPFSIRCCELNYNDML
jgi:hypothetical protein